MAPLTLMGVSLPLCEGSRSTALKHLLIIIELPRLLLAITSHYSQSPGGREPIDAGALLAHNGKVAVYSQYFQKEFWVFA
jgi:hypothetical protein